MNKAYRSQNQRGDKPEQRNASNMPGAQQRNSEPDEKDQEEDKSNSVPEYGGGFERPSIH